MRIFLSLGTNIGDRVSNLDKAISLINMEEQINIMSQSKKYETSPMENQNQDNFLNQVIQLDTDTDPFKLLKIIKRIEINLGRIKNNERYMPKIIVIDILAYNDLVINTQCLFIPLPKIKIRKFILKTWSDIAPDYILPNSKSSIKELLDKVYHLKDTVKEYN